MQYLLSGAEMTEADQRTSGVLGIPSAVLMERAALAVAGEIQKEFPHPGPQARIAIAAGKGNNGADALAVGRLLLDAGYEVGFFCVGECSSGLQYQILQAYRQEVRPLEDFLESWKPDAIVDGIFGTGLSRKVEGPAACAISQINQLHAKRGVRVFSVDLPSGVSATTGEILGTSVQADVTVTFSFYKIGQFLYPGCEACGQVVLAPIGITERSFPEEDGRIFPEVFTYREETAVELLPRRTSSGNKGTFGKVLVIAGSFGVSGACTMCASAVLRMGAGMVRVFTQEENRVILQKTVPEAMCSTYPRMPEGGLSEEEKERVRQELLRCLDWADVAAIGPGMGISKECGELLSFVLEQAPEKLRGLVLDADAIRLLAEDNMRYSLLKKAGEQMPVILTPHPAECAALFHRSIREVLENRFTWNLEFARRFSCTLVGKDARTLVASHASGRLYLNTSGNDGLATAGSGDVLTGMTAACLALGMDGFSAACAAVYLHGRAADRLADSRSRRSILATDLLTALSDSGL